MRKGLAIILAVVMIFSFSFVAFADSDKSNLSWDNLSITANMTLEDYQMYTWNIEKSVDEESVVVLNGDSETVMYTLTVIRQVNGDPIDETLKACITGTLTNIGDAQTTGLRVWAELDYQITGQGGTGGFRPLETGSLAITEQLVAGYSRDFTVCVELEPDELAFDWTTPNVNFRIRMWATADNQVSGQNKTHENHISLTKPTAVTTIHQNAIIEDEFGGIPINLPAVYLCEDGEPLDANKLALDFNEDFVQRENRYTYLYSVRIINNGYDGDNFSLVNEVTLMPDGVNEEGYETGSATLVVIVADPDPDAPVEGDENPAAPAVAAELLKEAGVAPRYGSGRTGGNYISDVAQHMGPGTDFEKVSKDHVEAYRAVVNTYLISKGAYK